MHPNRMSSLVCRRFAPLFAAIVFMIGPAAMAQSALPVEFGSARNVIIPQSRAFALYESPVRIRITGIGAQVRIVHGTARTTLQVDLINTSRQREEAVLLLPVPEGAVVSGFAFEGASREPTAKVLRADEARRLYDQIVARIRDPALLEFAGYNLVRSSVFPIPPGGRQRIRLTYEHILAGEGDRVDYILPRSEALDNRVPWRISVDLQAAHPVSMVYSPSHDLITRRLGSKRFSVQLAERAAADPGSFRLSYLLQREGVSASLLAYPDPGVWNGQGGYFLLMAGLPTDSSHSAGAIRREVTLVIDRSGSMAGGKMDQVRNAALQIIEGLADGEAFNIIDYSTTVSAFASRPVVKDAYATRQARRYLAAIRPGGGTNIHDALLEALRPEPRRGMLPMILFLTDGLPTVGKTGERAIRDMVERGNAHHRRIFTFGVGEDVNAPLLDRLAETTRGTSTYVLPGEDVELKVAGVFKRLSGPVLADVTLTARDAAGRIAMIPVEDVIPATMPDLFEDDQLIVLGRYRWDGPITFRLAGNHLGRKRTFEFTFDMRAATTRNAFVPRLWASRRIAELIDQIRQIGAPGTGAPGNDLSSGVFDPFADPRTRELAEAVLQLSTEYGILTEYTAILATAGTDLSDWENMRRVVGGQLRSRAIASRAGRSAVSQSLNLQAQKRQTTLNFRNEFVNEQLQLQEVLYVQQVADRAFFKRGNQWIDSRLVAQRQSQQPEEIILFGSEAYRRILRQLIDEGRQGVISLHGDIVIQLNNRTILVRNDAPGPRKQSE